jgi:hypothetical protein
MSKHSHGSTLKKLGSVVMPGAEGSRPSSAKNRVSISGVSDVQGSSRRTLPTPVNPPSRKLERQNTRQVFDSLSPALCAPFPHPLGLHQTPLALETLWRSRKIFS